MAGTGRGGRRRGGAPTEGAVPPILDRLDLLEAAPGSPPVDGPPTDGVQVGILRPLDLVVLDVRAVGMRLDTSTPSAPVLVHVDDDPAHLIITLPFQHLGEQAWLEQEGPVASTELANHRAARPSRLVFEVPLGTTIGFSSERILEAMRTLALRVVPAALPRAVRRRPRLGELTDIIVLPGGLAFGRRGNELVLTRMRTTQAEATLGGLLATSTTMRQVRLRLGDGTALFAGPPTDQISVAWAVPWSVGRPRRTPVRRPGPDETALEVPWRLILSPSQLGGFTHADLPVPAGDDSDHVELWHSRLGVRITDAEGVLQRVDEGRNAQRIVRAVWNRDREVSDTQPAAGSPADNAPVRTGLSVSDRWKIVRQSAETTVGRGGRTITPTPIEAAQVTLTSLGTSLGVHGLWDVGPYNEAGIEALLSWDHIAPLGRDQFVKVQFAGYLACTGHRWVWVKQTERLIEAAVEPVARLRTIQYMVAIDEVLTYDHRDFAYRTVKVIPTRTPNLREPVLPESTDTWIWPTLLSGEPFQFLLETTDHAGTVERRPAPLLWVNGALVDIPNPDGAALDKAYRDPALNRHRIPMHGDRVAYAPPIKPGDTTFETTRIHLRATVTQGKITPRLIAAEVVSPTARALTPQAAGFTMRYRDEYITNGFAVAPSANDPQLFAEVVDLTKADTIGLSAPATPLPPAAPGTYPGITFPSSEQSGGFVKADQEIAVLSRAKGTLGKLAASGVEPNTFDPATFLGAALPKLFGLFKLTEVLAAFGLDEMPAFVTKTLGTVQGLLDDIAELRQAVERAVADADQVIADAQAAGATAQTWATDTKAQLEALSAQLATAVDALTTELAALFDPTVPKDPTDIEALFTPIRTAHTTLATVVETIAFPPALKTPVRRLVRTLDPYLRDAAAVVDVVTQVIAFLDGLDPANLELRSRLDWSPRLVPWPSASNAIFSVRELEGGGLTIAVEMRVSATSAPSVDVLAELRRFDLTLFGENALMAMHFERLAFQGGSSRKPEVDVVFGGIEFLGPLSFIETLRRLIPFDGFSDPPFLEASAEGVRAGFTLALPNVAVGVFALSNISLGADCNVPFLGKHVSIGFNFCTRERPFSLTVMFVGGGGFVGVRAAPDGLELLEMSLEAGARLAIDLGIASGSVEIMVGVYLRLEAEKGSLTGYFRIRGEVDVLGIISASIELLLELIYEFETGKLVGRATLTIEVEVFMFSFSVSVSVERRLAGSNGDPSFAELMDVQPDGTSTRWAEYCEAFAGV